MKLGDEVKDTITGFRGIVTAKVEYLSGHTEWQVTPKNCKDDGSPMAPDWFHVSRLTTVSSAK